MYHTLCGLWLITCTWFLFRCYIWFLKHYNYSSFLLTIIFHFNAGPTWSSSPLKLFSKIIKFVSLTFGDCWNSNQKKVKLIEMILPTNLRLSRPIANTILLHFITFRDILLFFWEDDFSLHNFISGIF